MLAFDSLLVAKNEPLPTPLRPACADASAGRSGGVGILPAPLLPMPPSRRTKGSFGKAESENSQNPNISKSALKSRFLAYFVPKLAQALDRPVMSCQSDLSTDRNFGSNIRRFLSSATEILNIFLPMTQRMVLW